MMLASLFLSISLLAVLVDSATVLGFFPFPGKSHHNLFGPLMSELAARGHDVTYFTPIDVAKPHPRLREVKVKDYGPEVLGTLDFIELGKLSMVAHMQTVYDKMHILLDKVLQDDQVQELIHSKEKYDVVILESYFFQEANSALIHKFGAVGIDFIPLPDNVWINEISGISNQYSYMSDYKTLLTDDMTFWDRVYNTYAGWILTSTCYWNMVRMQRLMDRHFRYEGWESRPPLTMLMSNRSIIFVNKDPFLGYPYPTAPHVKQIGGINVVKNNPLPKELKSFLDSASDGFIYMSLGLNMAVSKVMDDKFDMFLKVFGSLKQKVLMKWEAEYKGKLPENVKTLEKFPQQDVLAHPNCVLFITHGGYLSLSETAYHGVPILGIPFYGDQPRNILWAQKAGIGVYLDHDNLTDTSLRWAINQVLTNKSYRLEMHKRSQLLKARRQDPMEEAIYWIEHALKFPNSLTPKSAYQSFIVLHQIDVILFILAMIAASLATMIVAIRFTLKQFARNEKLKIN